MSLAHLTLASRHVEQTAIFLERTLGYARDPLPPNIPDEAVWLNIGGLHGLPALPLLSAAFLLANGDLIWRAWKGRHVEPGPVQGQPLDEDAKDMS